MLPNGNILVVDDDEAQALLTQILLERLGYEVVTCMSGCDTLELVRSEGDRFRCIISDYLMFPMDGLELSRRILQVFPDANIFLTTASEFPAVHKEALEIGVRAIFRKPSTTEEFSKALLGAGL